MNYLEFDRLLYVFIPNVGERSLFETALDLRCHLRDLIDENWDSYTNEEEITKETLLYLIITDSLAKGKHLNDLGTI